MLAGGGVSTTITPGSVPSLGEVEKTVRVRVVEPEYGIVVLDVMIGVILALFDAGVATIVDAGVVPAAGIVIVVKVESPT